jgi:hypothetical protein
VLNDRTKSHEYRMNRVLEVLLTNEPAGETGRIV